jgi:hypothetical protein
LDNLSRMPFLFVLAITAPSERRDRAAPVEI